jgi:DNA-binding PadR family transcriptional regulator
MAGPRHGYEILQFLETGLGPSWRVSTSQLYALFKRLERDGLVRSNVELQGVRPSKRVFTLQPLGRRSFLDWLRSPTTHVRDLRIEFLAKLFFLRMLSIAGGDELIQSQIDVLERTKKRVTKRQCTEQDPYQKLVLSFRTATLKGWLQWLKKEAALFVKEENHHDPSNQ